MATTVECPRVLLITRNLPPLTGGMERLMQKTAEGLSGYSRLTIIGPTGCSRYCPVHTTVHETSPGLASFLLFSTWKAIKACKAHRYQLVVGGSGLVAPTIWLLEKLFHCKTIAFLHGLDLVVNNPIYQAIFLPCIRRMDRLIANSGNTRDIAVQRGVPGGKLSIINPGTSLPELAQLESREELVQRRQIPFSRLVLFVGRMTKRKGLSRFIEQSLPATLSAVPDAGLVVVGENPDQSLNKLGEQAQVVAAVQRLGLQDRVKFLGQVSDAELLAWYAAADVQVFPLIEVPGDVEGFGMVAVEAAACGTPTIAFRVGGVPDAVSTANGQLVDPGRYDLFSDAVVAALSGSRPGADECIEHARRFSWENFHREIRELFQSLY